MTATKELAPRPETAIAPFAQMERAADAVVKSGFFGIKTREEALTLMMLAQSEGLHFATALREFHVIQGRPAMKADAMLARFQRNGGKVRWITLTDELVSAEFSHPQGGSAVITWDDARVVQAGLDKNPMHKKYGRQMKRSRVASEGVRTVFPGAISGMYSVEEMQDVAFEEQGRTQVEAPAQIAAPLGKVEGESGTGLTDEEIQEHTDAINNAGDDKALKAAFSSAWKHGTDAKDETSKSFFKRLYDEQKVARGFAVPV